MTSDRIEFRVPSGAGVRSIAQIAQTAGIRVQPDAMVAAARLAGHHERTCAPAATRSSAASRSPACSPS